jgi:hypothetical protein
MEPALRHRRKPRLSANEPPQRFPRAAAKKTLALRMRRGVDNGSKTHEKQGELPQFASACERRPRPMDGEEFLAKEV